MNQALPKLTSGLSRDEIMEFLQRNDLDIQQALARGGAMTLRIGDDVERATAIADNRRNARIMALVDLNTTKDPFKYTQDDLDKMDAGKAAEIREAQAEVRQIAIRHFEAVSDVSFSALMMEVLDALRANDYQALGMENIDEWVEATLVQPKMRTVVKKYLVQTIAPLDTIEVVDQEGRRVLPEHFIIDRPSFIEEVGTLGKKLQLLGENANPDDIATYKQAMSVAATGRKEDVRDFMEDKGFRNPRFDKEDVEYIIVTKRDPATKQPKYVYRFVIETETEANANFIQTQLHRRFRFPIPQTDLGEVHEHYSGHHRRPGCVSRDVP